ELKPQDNGPAAVTRLGVIYGVSAVAELKLCSAVASLGNATGHPRRQCCGRIEACERHVEQQSTTPCEWAEPGRRLADQPAPILLSAERVRRKRWGGTSFGHASWDRAPESRGIGKVSRIPPGTWSCTWRNTR